MDRAIYLRTGPAPFGSHPLAQRLELSRLGRAYTHSTGGRLKARNGGGSRAQAVSEHGHIRRSVLQFADPSLANPADFSRTHAYIGCPQIVDMQYIYMYRVVSA